MLIVDIDKYVFYGVCVVKFSFGV